MFVLDVDAETLKQRLSVRPDNEFGGKPEEQEFVLQLIATKEDIPLNAIVVDATAPLPVVVDSILSRCRASTSDQCSMLARSGLGHVASACWVSHRRSAKKQLAELTTQC